MRLDSLSQAELENTDDDTLRKKVEILEGFAHQPREGKERLLTLRFLVSPTELIADDDGGVRAIRIVSNELVSDGGRLRPRATKQTEELPVDLVFRSVGYRGLPMEGLPFHESWGVIPNESGRVIDPETGQPVRGMYVSGWIKRGPTGVIGTNKKDGTETAGAMLEDAGSSSVLDPQHPGPSALDSLVRARQPHLVNYDDWSRLDELEQSRGEAGGRPRVKFTSRAEMRAALGD